MAFVPLNTNNSNLANYNSVNSLMLDYQGFKKTVGTSSAEGWVSGVLPSVSSVAYNGNRSYDITFAGPVTDYLSPGMRLKTVRQVPAPTQSTLLNGTTQYWSKTSPAGLTFTTTFTCMAWIKLSSYQLGGIIARRNADTEGWSFRVNSNGTLALVGLRIASNSKAITSYQSIPLDKWVHVAASMDASAGDTTAQKIWIDGVEVSRTYAVAGTVTAIVQGTTALTVGAQKSDGSDKFPGEIAQAAVFSAVLSDATIKSYYSQGLSGTETSLVSAYSFDGTANDLNTTNANNLTAQGSATATNADSPFSVNGLGTSTGTDDYALVQTASSTTATVQVPSGCTIPTSGGISATYVSTVKNPFNWISDNERWEVIAISPSYLFNPTNATWYNLNNLRLRVPVGAWSLGYQMFNLRAASNWTTSTFLVCYSLLSTTSASIGNAFEQQRWYGTSGIDGYATGNVVYTCNGTVNRESNVQINSATIYYLNYYMQTGGTVYTVTAQNGCNGPFFIRALPSGL